MAPPAGKKILFRLGGGIAAGLALAFSLAGCGEGSDTPVDGRGTNVMLVLLDAASAGYLGFHGAGEAAWSSRRT